MRRHVTISLSTVRVLSTWYTRSRLPLVRPASANVTCASVGGLNEPASSPSRAPFGGGDPATSRARLRCLGERPERLGMLAQAGGIVEAVVGRDG